ncbi:MAG: 2-phospho-L-lactate guanylyltransferase [Dehalococcoidia bacterium]
MDQRRIRAIVPMKPITEGKSRLAPMLDADQRALLSLTMLLRVLGASTATPGIKDVVVYGGDDAVRHACELAGAGWRPDPGLGLNGCMTAGFSDATDEGSTHGLFLPADLPLLTSEALSMLIEAGQNKQMAIAPDLANDGTNALLIDLDTDFPTLLGEASYDRHVQQARQLGVDYIIHRPSNLRLELGLDIDTPTDMERLMDLTPYIWADLGREIREAGLEASLPENPGNPVKEPVEEGTE